MLAYFLYPEDGGETFYETSVLTRPAVYHIPEDTAVKTSNRRRVCSTFGNEQWSSVQTTAFFSLGNTVKISCILEGMQVQIICRDILIYRKHYWHGCLLYQWRGINCVVLGSQCCCARESSNHGYRRKLIFKSFCDTLSYNLVIVGLCPDVWVILMISSTNVERATKFFPFEGVSTAVYALYSRPTSRIAVQSSSDYNNQLL